ncbi:MAG: c-type cytochrome domain-containing protein [Chthoniobacter sp.]|uniref:WD40 domain-containing protein n=1 Tax=Chthoniobacter sp. TaxID=2510640 RepID=UPI0032AAE960
MKIFAPFALTIVLTGSAAFAAKAPIAIAEPKRATAVDFDREVRPFLSDNCLSCHCQTTTKGGLNLETPELMLKGGDSGAAITPQKGSESLILQAAAHLDNDLAMPPRDNKAKAKNLTPEQLGLLKLWIDQGAKASPKTERIVQWQPLAESLGAIFAVAVTGDGQFAACARENRIFIYHVPSGRLVATEAGHRDQVNALAFSPDGTLMASGDYREVKLWRRTPMAGKPAQPLAPNESSKLARVDGKTLVLLNAEGKQVGQVDHGEAIVAFALRGDGQRIVTAGGNIAKLWSADGKPIAELRGNRYAREFADQQDRALQIETGNVAYRKDAVDAAQKALQVAQDRVKKSTEAIVPKEQDVAAKQKGMADAKAGKVAADQALVAAETELKNAEAKLQDAAAKAAKLAASATEAIKGVAAVDANKLAADAAAGLQEAAKARAERDQREAQRKQAADKIEPANKQVAAAEEAAKNAETAKHVAETELALARAEEQKNAGSVTEANAAAVTVGTARTKAEETLQAARQAAAAAEQSIRAVTFSTDGSTVVTAGDDQIIHTWSAENGAAYEVLKGHSTAVTSLAFAPNGELISTAGDGAALAWNLTPEWKLERTIGTGDAGSPLTDRVNAVAFSPDGKQLATGSGEPSRGGELKLWDIGTGQLVRDFPRVHSDAVLSLEFSPDGKLLASGAADKMARVTELATGKTVRNFEGHTHHVLGVSWSADGRTLATAGADGMVKVWDFTTGDRKKNIEGYDKEVTAVRFVGTTANVVTSSGDNKVRLVGLDGKEVRVFPEVADFMESAAVSADGKLVVAGGQDSVLRVWNAADGGKLATFAPVKK